MGSLMSSNANMNIKECKLVFATISPLKISADKSVSKMVRHQLFLVIVAVAVGYCASTSYGYVRRDKENPNYGVPSLLSTKYIDLSHAFNNRTAVWPGRKITFFTEFEGRDENGIWVASHGFCTSEHTSTHIDAPYHFNQNGRQLHEIPFEDLINIKAVMIDIYDKVHRFRDGKLKVIENYALTRDDVLEWEQINGQIPQGGVVLVRTGWDTRWGNEKLFRGENEETEGEPPADAHKMSNEFSVRMHSTTNKHFYDPAEAWMSLKLRFPGFDASAAKYLAEERAVRGVGIDVISIDPGNQNKFSPAHRIFANRNIYMMEMVANMHNLPPRGFNLWIVPFKIDRGTGAPARVIAKLNGDRLVNEQ